MKIDVIFPVYLFNRDIEKTVAKCFATFDEHTSGVRKIVVDNGSVVGSSMVDGFADKTIWFKDPIGYGPAVNAGLKDSRADVMVVLNDDLTFTKGWLRAILKPLKDKVGVSTILVSDRDGLNKKKEITLEGVRFGACWAVTKEVIEKVGYLDEQFKVGTFEDDDYRLRVKKAGFKVALNKNGLVYHVKPSQTMDFADPDQKHFDANRVKFEKKWES